MFSWKSMSEKCSPSALDLSVAARRAREQKTLLERYVKPPLLPVRKGQCNVSSEDDFSDSELSLALSESEASESLPSSPSPRDVLIADLQMKCALLESESFQLREKLLQLEAERSRHVKEAEKTTDVGMEDCVISCDSHPEVKLKDRIESSGPTGHLEAQQCEDVNGAGHFTNCSPESVLSSAISFPGFSPCSQRRLESLEAQQCEDVNGAGHFTNCSPESVLSSAISFPGFSPCSQRRLESLEAQQCEDDSVAGHFTNCSPASVLSSVISFPGFSPCSQWRLESGEIVQCQEESWQSSTADHSLESGDIVQCQEESWQSSTADHSLESGEIVQCQEESWQSSTGDRSFESGEIVQIQEESWQSLTTDDGDASEAESVPTAIETPPVADHSEASEAEETPTAMKSLPVEGVSHTSLLVRPAMERARAPAMERARARRPTKTSNVAVAESSLNEAERPIDLIKVVTPPHYADSISKGHVEPKGDSGVNALPITDAPLSDPEESSAPAVEPAMPQLQSVEALQQTNSPIANCSSNALESASTNTVEGHCVTCPRWLSMPRLRSSSSERAPHLSFDAVISSEPTPVRSEPEWFAGSSRTTVAGTLQVESRRHYSPRRSFSTPVEIAPWTLGTSQSSSPGAAAVSDSPPPFVCEQLASPRDLAAARRLACKYMSLPATPEAFQLAHDQVGLPLMQTDLGSAYCCFEGLNALHIKIHGKPSSNSLYNMACCLSLGAGDVAPRTAGLPPYHVVADVQGTRLDQAALLLAAAVDAGYRNVQHMLTDPDLAMLRLRLPRQFAACTGAASMAAQHAAQSSPRCTVW
eukprot:TRINITY_DN2248_c0_g1_i2.p1 TRINITY_DN2248_c0_g1~~TRINITY_DN2248_c0_g1_i2.p1  ORF type:complete len:817 (-),score=146.35 TRINITY_DN2248_c0_g1_i2:49-2499(-)